MANIKVRRRLSDLYQKGVEVRFGKNKQDQTYWKVGPFEEAATDDEIVMWCQPPSPLQREQAMRDAQASRARSLIRAKREKDSEEYLTILAFLSDMDDETMIDYVLLSNQDTRQNDATREVLAMDEWSDMLGYQDLARQFDEMSEEEREKSEDYKDFMALDKKFGDQVAERARELRDAEYDVLKMSNRETWEKKALDKRSQLVASQAFMAEYERQMMFYSVRDPDDHGVMFFESARELAEVDDEIREAISTALEPFIDDVGEAKNSQGAAHGSQQSEPPSEQETSEASIPEERTA